MTNKTRRKRRLLSKFAGLLVVIVIILVTADLVTRSIAGDLAGAAKHWSSARSASAHVGPFPFLYHLVVEGTVPQLNVSLSDVPVGPLELDRVDLHATGVRIDRHALFGHHRITVVAIDAVEATVDVTAGELSQAIGHEVDVSGGGTISVHIGPLTIPARLSLAEGDVLSVAVAGIHLFKVNLSESSSFHRAGCA